MARAVFRGKVHIGYLAAIVAASNAGGSGSVVGDTTTTMMWIDGVNPLDVLARLRRRRHGARRSSAWSPPRQQHAYSPIVQGRAAGHARRLGARRASWPSSWSRRSSPTSSRTSEFPEVLDLFPVIGAAVWAAHPGHRAPPPARLVAAARRPSRGRSSCSAWSPAPR